MSPETLPRSTKPLDMPLIYLFYIDDKRTEKYIQAGEGGCRFLTPQNSSVILIRHISSSRR